MQSLPRIEIATSPSIRDSQNMKSILLRGIPNSARWMLDGAGENSLGVGLELLPNLLLLLVDDRLANSELK